MSYVIVYRDAKTELYVSKWFEETVEKHEFTENIKDAIVFPDMPKAHGFLKHYHLERQGFSLWQTQLPPTEINYKTPRMQAFSI